MPLPPVDSMVNVYDTTVPFLSETTRWVVDWRGWETVADWPAAAPPGSPGSTGLVAARVGLISARRWAAKLSDSSPRSGTSKNSGSARKAARSA